MISASFQSHWPTGITSRSLGSPLSAGPVARPRMTTASGTKRKAVGMPMRKSSRRVPAFTVRLLRKYAVSICVMKVMAP